VQQTVVRRQFPITPADTFTDYRSQGQTISHVNIDLASPPSGSLTPFNVYVALSRSAGHSTIRLLRDFDDLIFLKAFNIDLTQEDEHLQGLVEKTERMCGNPK
jgi:hypothetical protein